MYKIISEDNYIWDQHKLIMYLYQCMASNENPMLDFFLEGPCAETNGLYQLLDFFCDQKYYPKEKITVRTGNVVEQHQFYNFPLLNQISNQLISFEGEF